MKYGKNMVEVSTLQPDYMGFIFYDQSVRYFDDIIPALPSNISKVGVFVNAEINEIIQRIDEHQLNVIQLHGQESPDYCQSFHDLNIEIIKVFSLLDEFDFDVLKPYESVCDYFLFDTKGKLPGGNGHAFDWTVLNDYPSSKPFFLSGGIGIEQLGMIEEFMNHPVSEYCHAIDVNSRFEIEPGLKDLEQLKEFKSRL